MCNNAFDLLFLASFRLDHHSVMAKQLNGLSDILAWGLP